MTGGELRRARKALGMTQRELAEALRLGKDGGRHVRRVENGQVPVTGPVEVATLALLSLRRHMVDPIAAMAEAGASLRVEDGDRGASRRACA